MNYIQFEGKILRRQWKLLGEIGRGKHSVIYVAQNLVSGVYVAVKIEENQMLSRLQNEAKILYQLQTAKKNYSGIPQIHWVGVDNLMSDYNFMIFELLGPSLQILFNICNRKFSLKTVLMISIQSLQILENLHDQNFVHNDIKPANFVMGLDNQSHNLFLIDYGMSKQYRDYQVGQHIVYKEKQVIQGNPKFISINTHYNIEQSRRDDLESLAYMLIYFAKGHLPWENKKLINAMQLYSIVCEEKQKTVMEEFCHDLPHIFIVFLNYVKNLSFSETPDYLFLRSLFENYFIEKEYEFDYKYDWTRKRNIDERIIEDKKYNIEYQEESSNISQLSNKNEQNKIDNANMLQSQNYRNQRKSSFSIRRQETQKTLSKDTSQSSIDQNSYKLTDSDIKYDQANGTFESLDKKQFSEKSKQQQQSNNQKSDSPIQQQTKNKLKVQNEDLNDLRRTTSKRLKQYKSLDSKNTQNKHDKSIQKSKSGKEGNEDDSSEENTISKLSFSEDKTIESDFEIQFSNESFKF